MFKSAVIPSGHIWYRMEGTGYPVMLVHGFAEDGTVWQEQIKSLSKHFKLIIPDLAGSGRSALYETNASEAPSTIEDHAKTLNAIITAEGISSCTMIGHSMGGYISLAFAEMFGDTLDGLGLFHSTALADDEQKKELRRKGIAFIRKQGAAVFLQQTTPSLFSTVTKAKNPDLVADFVGRYDNFNPYSLVSYYDAMIKRPDRTSVLKSFSKPVLFIFGEQDKAVPLAQGLAQAHYPTISYIHILKNAQHMGMIEAPETANQWLLSFLQNVQI